ncbi:hypothetical protein O6H91_13G068900 [Diphasiastrum complanatum]|uniref:Uncharacterized protein n=1 Tax=Diphasiastrum complanatum TaxID=34168 RepID=A0ACC2BVS3_DIPCM|nr:hypothetical protein O6H91_13G068900 [Diphasiastrum complanatum]
MASRGLSFAISRIASSSCTRFRSASSLSGSKAVAWGHLHQQNMSSAGQEPDTHDDFKPVPKSSDTIPSVHEHIEKDIKENSVLVYMKGVPEAPQCGFSAMVVRVLQQYDVPFKSRNVLADQELREGIKAFSSWPTIPQVFINGEFVGGSDILMNMHRSGELEDKLKGVKSASTPGES